MHITALSLYTPNLAAQRQFYETILGLSPIQETADSFTIQAGATRMTFHEIARQEGIYHYAFTIPRNKFAQAKSWLAARVPLLTYRGQDELFIDTGEVRSLYFYDATGNIAEFIVHGELPDETPGEFGPHDILHASEIGLVVDDVPAQVAALKTRLGLDPYRWHADDQFTAVGDIYGLFIVVKVGRPWFPSGELAEVAPLSATILGPRQQRYQPSPTCTIEVLEKGLVAEG